MLLIEMEMGRPLIFMLLKLIILCSLSISGSAGFEIPSLSAASVFLRLNLGTTELASHRTTASGPTATPNGPNSSPVSTSPSSIKTRHGVLAQPPSKSFHKRSPTFVPPNKAPTRHHGKEHLKKALAPSASSSSNDPSTKLTHGPASSPSFSFYKHHHARHKRVNIAPGPSSPLPSPTHSYPGLAPAYSPPTTRWRCPTQAPSPATPSGYSTIPIPSPGVSPMSSSAIKKASPPPMPFLAFPPPPPNKDCTSVTCAEPLTYTPTGSPCGCVWPIAVRLRLNVALYAFFPLVAELANEIATSLSLNRSQVRIMGANAADQQLEKTIVLVSLVPSHENFDKVTALSIYNKFWLRKVLIKTSLFGTYQVVYVRYPGLPSSPPSMPSDSGIDGMPYPGHDNGGTAVKPLGVDVPRNKKDDRKGSMIAVIVISSVTAFSVLVAVIWLLLMKRGCTHRTEQNQHVLMSSNGKFSGTPGSLTLPSRPSSGSVSSSLLAYTGTAKIFHLSDIERATGNFEHSRILGEGGFGLVYSGTLDDGRKVAVKVLKRDDRQGSREFLAEVEMLGRLHHRNLVKLIGICSQDHTRCLVYELVPNGSVESHLHGVDKEASPLDWGARMKIALGSARGLAYLHEDSSPRVIHRDFKSSNILLEDDFTPKVSDFGLARTAFEEGNKHISTHVMGTFGYLAPEYAMTGHLLVKSDVYSYGVVLLELLTGRKPVDLSQPPGQENLVAWARPLLATSDGLEAIIDPTLKLNIAFESAAKVAAIASMCVQPEVSRRPFIGEVVQALNLVCSEFEEPLSRSFSRADTSIDVEARNRQISSERTEAVPVYDSVFDSNLAMSSSTNLVSASARFEEAECQSFRKHSNSAPLRMERRKPFWQKLRGFPRGSMSERGFALKLWSGPR